MPPWITPVCSVECGTSKRASFGSSRAIFAASARMKPTSCAAYSTAFTAVVVSDECASRPRMRQQKSRLPLWATIACMSVGSPMMQPAGLMPRSARSATSPRTPRKVVSSSKVSDRCTGSRACAARNLGAQASAMAMKPFMSAVPRPWMRPSRCAALNGSVAHSWPSTGTTSVCPDSTMPRVFIAAASSASVQNRFAFLPVLS